MARVDLFNRYVIFKEFGKYKVTKLSNYSNGIIDLDFVVTIKDVYTYEDAKQTIMRLYNLQEECIVNETGE